jgi:hypothetical protein
MSIEFVPPKASVIGYYKDFQFVVGNRGKGMPNYVMLSSKKPISDDDEDSRFYIETVIDNMITLQSLNPMKEKLKRFNYKLSDGEGLVKAINSKFKELEKDPEYVKSTGYVYQ